MLQSRVVKQLGSQGERAAAYIFFAPNMLCLWQSLSFRVEILSFFLCKMGEIKPVLWLFRKPTKKMNLRVGWWGNVSKCFSSLKNSIRKSRCWYCNYYLIPKWWERFQKCALLDEPIHFQPPLMNLGIEYLSSWNNWHILVKRLHSSDEILDSYWKRGERRVTWEQYCFMDLYPGY